MGDRDRSNYGVICNEKVVKEWKPIGGGEGREDRAACRKNLSITPRLNSCQCGKTRDLKLGEPVQQFYNLPRITLSLAMENCRSEGSEWTTLK